MIEVEAKISVKNVNKVRRIIKSIGRFIRKEKKIDDYYTLEPIEEYPKKSLRVRDRGKFFEVNFKKRLSYVNGVHAKNEEEFKVSDLRGFLDLINDFGFKKMLRKIKMCEIYNVKKGFNIELNRVEGLGWFIEIECLVNRKKDIRKARREVTKVVKRLGFGKDDLIKTGYTKQLFNKK